MAGDQLAQHRNARGLSRTDVARAVGVHPSTVANLENGHQERASYRLLEQVAKVVRTDVDALIRGGGA
ncbi:MAG: helix-turn-helix transcriptional regulator [Saccharothrix sp.]|nr:helix-turn-helix transcriptional regulator [Saccharothrix sp.]